MARGAEEAAAYNVRGKAYLALGDTDRGMDDLEKAGELEAKRLCLVCMELPRGARLHPCMHAALCTTCAKSFQVGRFRNHVRCPRHGEMERGSEGFTTILLDPDACNIDRIWFAQLSREPELGPPELAFFGNPALYTGVNRTAHLRSHRCGVAILE